MHAQAYTGHYYHNDAFALPSGGTYTAKLSLLDKCVEGLEHPPLPSHLSAHRDDGYFGRNTLAVTNLDSRFTHLIVKGLKSVYRIGFQGNAIPVWRAKKNMLSARPIQKWWHQIYLDQELRAGWGGLAGPDKRSCPTVKCSRGVIPLPKKRRKAKPVEINSGPIVASRAKCK